MNRIQMIHREPARQLDAMHPFGVRAAQEALAFHCSMPGYCETPLFSLRALARALGVASIHVKDESQRFDLNAFKVLGGSVCISRILAERFDLPKADFAARRGAAPRRLDAWRPRRRDPLPRRLRDVPRRAPRPPGALPPRGRAGVDGQGGAPRGHRVGRCIASSVTSLTPPTVEG